MVFIIRAASEKMRLFDEDAALTVCGFITDARLADNPQTISACNPAVFRLELPYSTFETMLQK